MRRSSHLQTDDIDQHRRLLPQIVITKQPSPFCLKKVELTDTPEIKRWIILDEVQAIPVDLLQPVLATIQELVLNYGCSVVLCAATQPAFNWSGDFRIGLTNITEIIPNPSQLFERLRRVQISHLGKQSDEELALLLATRDQFLYIVNTQAHGAKLFDRFARDRQATLTDNTSTAWPVGHGLNACAGKRTEFEFFRPARRARIETALRHPDEFTNVNQAPNSIFIDLTPFCSKSLICRSTRAGAMLQFQGYQVPLRPQMV